TRASGAAETSRGSKGAPFSNAPLGDVTVALAAHRFDRILADVAQLLTEFADVNVDRSRLDSVRLLHLPNVAQKNATGNDSSWFVGKEPQEGELARAQVDEGFSAARTGGSRIDLQGPARKGPSRFRK